MKTYLLTFVCKVSVQVDESELGDAEAALDAYITSEHFDSLNVHVDESSAVEFDAEFPDYRL